MLSAPSQLLLRNAALFEQGRWLLINPTDITVFQQLEESNVWGFHQSYDQFSQLPESERQRHIFSHQYPSDETFDGIVIYMPKAKAHLNMLLAQAKALVTDNGVIAIVGDNKSGAKSAGKVLSQYTDGSQKLDAARHCSLFMGQVNSPSDSFDISQWYKDVVINIDDKKLILRTLPGVFSHGELDAATALLLSNLPFDHADKMLDFACGAGVIGVWAAKYANVNTLVMSDVNALALHCAQSTATLNDVEATIVASDGLSQVQGKFDTVVTNPPFHTGIKTDYSITENFIAQIRHKLCPNYRVLLVANRFLPYPDLLAKHIKQPVTVAQTSKFNLYYCSR